MRHIALILLSTFALASAQSARFTLTSPDIRDGSSIPNTFVFNDFGCTGNNVSPALRWSGAPAETKSFALIVHDPDGNTGVGGFTHWIVYNIPARATGLPRGVAPDASNLPRGAVQALSSFGTAAWGGPCPPKGEAPHRYVFTLYALRVDRLDLPANASQALVGFTINGHALGKASFTGTYGR